MANIVQIQDDLKNVSDQNLVDFVKRPTGQVPSYLALGEIKRRKETRDKYQGEKAQQKTTVADDLVAAQGIGNQMTQNPMSQPTAGVGTPQPQEPINPAMLASKGIGQLNPGAVKQMNDGGIVGYAGDDGMSLVGEEEIGKKLQKIQAENARKNYRYGPSELGFADGPVSYPLLTAAGDAASYLNPLSYMDTYNPRVDPLTGNLVGGVGDRFADTKAEILARETQKRDDKASSDAEKRIAQRDIKVSDPSIVDDYTVSSMQEVTEYVPGMLTTNVFDTETITEGDSSSNVVPTSMDVTDEVKETVKVDDGDTDTIDSKLDIADLDLPSVLSPEQVKLFADMDSKRPDKLNSKDALSQVRKRNIEAGLLDNPFDQDRKDIDKERELLEKAKSDAGSMAFIKAGLLWMQKGNLGDAAPAVTEYEQALKGLRGEDRELKKMDLALRGADIAFKQGNVKAASELTTAAEKRLDTFDQNKFTNFNNALISGYKSRNDMMRANITKNTQIAIAESNAKTSRYVADKSATKLDATGQNLAAAQKDPAFYKKGPKGEPVFDYAKFASSRASTMYPGKNAADIKIARIEGYQTIIKDIATKEGTDAAQEFMKAIPFDVYIAATEKSKLADSIIGN